VNIFTKTALKQAAAKYKDAADELEDWYTAVSGAAWVNFVELRSVFPSADDVDGIIVFNVRHNRYRLLTVIKYDRIRNGKHINGSIYIKAFMTHAQYERWSALSRQEREKSIWPQS
jgi:mRNA interferase HigB